ncbi:hypothetical protein HDU93_009420 [Gonapodya sp. JEL0774]|nr:hypothetical protein HDU93_009420 [Gonapodya sp. JEL0774]
MKSTIMQSLQLVMKEIQKLKVVTNPESFIALAVQQGSNELYQELKGLWGDLLDIPALSVMQGSNGEQKENEVLLDSEQDIFFTKEKESPWSVGDDDIYGEIGNLESMEEVEKIRDDEIEGFTDSDNDMDIEENGVADIYENVTEGHHSLESNWQNAFAKGDVETCKRVLTQIAGGVIMQVSVRL